MGKKWTYEEDQKLIELHKQYGKQWGVIAQHIKTRTASQVAARWEKCLDPALTKGPFTQEEDQLIIDYVKQNGPQNWPGLCELLKNRSPKQCRERWFNHLDPNIISKPWTSEEDALIFNSISKYGKKWSIIAKFLPGRTDNAIKNRWNSSISKRIIFCPNGIKKLGPDLSKRRSYISQQNYLQAQKSNDLIKLQLNECNNCSPGMNFAQQNLFTQKNPQIPGANNVGLIQPINSLPSLSHPQNMNSVSNLQFINNLNINNNMQSTIIESHNQIDSKNIHQKRKRNQKKQSSIPSQPEKDQQFIASNSIIQFQEQESKPIPHFKREAAGMQLHPIITNDISAEITNFNLNSIPQPPAFISPVSTNNINDNGKIDIPTDTSVLNDNNNFSSITENQQTSSPFPNFSLFSPKSTNFSFSPIQTDNGGFSFGSSGSITPVFSPFGGHNWNADVFK